MWNNNDVRMQVIQEKIEVLTVAELSKRSGIIGTVLNCPYLDQLTSRFGQCEAHDLVTPPLLSANTDSLMNEWADNVIKSIVLDRKPDCVCCVVIYICGRACLYGRKVGDDFIPFVFNANLIEEVFIDTDDYDDAREDGYSLAPSGDDLDLNLGLKTESEDECRKRDGMYHRQWHHYRRYEYASPMDGHVLVA